MDNFGEKHRSNGKHLRGLWAGLLILGGFISWLVNLVNVTQQDLMEAGVYLRQTRD